MRNTFTTVFLFLSLLCLGACGPQVLSPAQRQSSYLSDTATKIDRVADKISTLYEGRLTEVGRTACGNTTPCADPDAAQAAMIAEAERWSEVRARLDYLRRSQVIFQGRLELCCNASGNDCRNTDASTCAVDMFALEAGINHQFDSLACALADVSTSVSDITCTRPDDRAFLPDPSADAGVSDAARD